MQKLILIFLSQFIVCFVFAQNVGIGTTAPEHILDVRTGGGKLKTYTYGAEFSVNTTGGWARGFRLRNEGDSLGATVFGSIHGHAYISSGFDADLYPTGYQNRQFVLLKSGNVGIGNTNPLQKLHVQGNVRVEDRSIYLGADQRIYGDASSSLHFYGNHSTVTQFILRDKEDDIYGRLYGSGDGIRFGLLDGDANWSYRAEKDLFTSFLIDNSEKMRILADGNVGIGTTAPVQKLHIKGNVRVDNRSVYLGADQRVYGDASSALHFYGNHSTITQFILRDKEDDIYGRLYGSGDGARFGLLDGDANWSYRAEKDLHTSFLINNSEKMRIMANGNVGIGTASPQDKLHVVLGAGSVKTFTTGLEFATNTTGGWARGFRLRNESNNMQTTVYGSLNGTAYIATGFDVTQSATGYQDRKLVVLANGNVGIGSNTPNSKLAVNGNIRSREVLVETANWPDYVFKEEYRLPTLQEEATFIEENGHLSGFQSEEEMDNTITVGDVTKRQQEKIEQMMLHLIKMEEEIEKLRAENEAFKLKFKELED